MDAQDLRLLFEVIDVKAQSKINEHQDDALLRRFKDKWLFLVTLLIIITAFFSTVVFVAFHPESPQLPVAMNGGIALVMALAGYYVRGKND